VSTVYMGLVVAEWHCRAWCFFATGMLLPNVPHSGGSGAATRKPAVAPDATVPHSSSRTMRKRAASLVAAIDSGFEGEPEVTVDHSASGPDAADFIDVASGGGGGFLRVANGSQSAALQAGRSRPSLLGQDLTHLRRRRRRPSQPAQCRVPEADRTQCSPHAILVNLRGQNIPICMAVVMVRVESARSRRVGPGVRRRI
jgi:hypothetical protein